MRGVVVGGGLAGAAAALELARQGAEVHRVEAGPGATALCWGSLDVAGAVPGSRRLRWRTPLRDVPLTGRDRLAILIGAYANHPYAVLWQGRESPGPAAGTPDAGTAADAVKRMVADLDAALAPQGLRIEGSLDENRLLADAHGSVRVCDFAFTGAAGGDLLEPPEIAWVQLRGLPADPPAVALRRLAAERAVLGLPPAPLRTVELALPPALPVTSGARLAAALDAPEALATLAGLARTARSHAAAGRLWLFPPVLGLAGVARSLDRLREAVGSPVAETRAAVPDAIPGFRLKRALDAALAQAGVALHRGRVLGLERRGARASGVRIAEAEGAPGERPAERTLAADAVVLATGRFLAGGLREVEGRVEEPLLGLPLVDSRGERVDGRAARASVRRRYLDAQPLFSAGVATDARLRPLSAPGAAPLLENVFAAGDLLGGFDPSRERTGLGVALVTGTLAARHAAAAEAS